MKWIDKMVERITRKETALNDPFSVLLIYNSTRGNNRGKSPSLK